MKYMDIWKAPQRVAPEKKTAVTMTLPRRVNDWPEDARKEFKRVKNELWKWAKKQPGRDRSGLALIAYQAVKEAWEGKPPASEGVEIINCKTEEELWDTILKLARS